MLESLKMGQLRRLAKDVFAERKLPKRKSELIDCLTKTRRVGTSEILTKLDVSALRLLCKQFNVTPARTKTLMTARLLGDNLGEARIIVKRSLRAQGYRISNSRIEPPTLESKESIRKMHRLAVEHKRDVARKALAAREKELLAYIANGEEVSPSRIVPRICIVESRSTMELLFRYASLHWSIPVSAGYGRRLRALIFDENNEKLIGIIGLCDPVYALRPRDSWIGWSVPQKADNIKHLADAYVLGAVPPYSSLLCGKLVAMLACSAEIREAFACKYYDRTSLISKTKHNGILAAITTTSALGRSSIYNRIRHEGVSVYRPLGYTAGTGDFQFLNGAYDTIRETASIHGLPSAKHQDWGAGYRNRREVVQEFLKATGIDSTALRHGIKRQVFIAPLARNSRDYLSGRSQRLEAYDWTAHDLFRSFYSRWVEPRLQQNNSYREFKNDSWRLWGGD